MDLLKRAIYNMSRCSKDHNLSSYCNIALLFLKVDIQRKNPHLGDIPGLKDPAEYLESLSKCYESRDHSNGEIEMTLARAYVDLNTPERASQGIQALMNCVDVSPTRPEAYLMLSKYYFDHEMLD